MSNNSVSVAHTQMRTIIVDGGRTSGQSEGFCEAGAMDDLAYNFANYLAANPSNTPALEVMGSLTLVFHCDATIAVCGPSCILLIDGQQVKCWQSVTIKREQTVSISSERLGQRAYIAIHGQWDVPTIHGSACTVLREQLGGLSGTGRTS